MLDVGQGTHGTGDIRGYNISIEYKKRINTRTSLLFGFASTIHSGQKDIYYQNSNGQNIDGSYRYTTSGIQLMTKVDLNILRKNNFELGSRIGTLARYQSSSFYDDLTVLFPTLTGLTFPVTSIVNRTPQETLALGVIGQIYTQYKFTKKHFIGLSTGFQLDTNGDSISQISISTGITL